MASRLAFAPQQRPTTSGRAPLLVVLALLALLALPTSALAVSPHAGSAEKDTCASCHVPHKAATASGIFKDVGPVKGESPLCYTCHDGAGASGNVKTGPDSFFFGNGHVLEGMPTTSSARDLTNSCSDCHKPHGDPALLPSLPGSKVNSATVGTTGNVWCFACHDDAQSWYAKRGSYPALSGPSRDASGYPVAGTFAGASVYTSPTANAHIGIPARSGAATRTAGDCLYCHNAHGSASRYDSLSATFSPSSASSVAGDRATGAYAALCFTCHGGGSWEASGAANIKRYVTHEATDTSALASGGHRIKSAGAKLPVDSPLPCYDCHNPHGSSRGNKRLISDALGASLDTSAGPEAVRRFCLTCHVTSETLGWDSVAATYTAVPASATVEGLRRDGGANGSGPGGSGKNWLSLRAAFGHSRLDASVSCYECHGGSYTSASNNNVHDPLAFDEAAHAAPASSCAAPGCHAGGGSLVSLHSSATTTVAGQTRVSCQVCHAEGTPASGACSSCHDVTHPHGDDDARHTANLGTLTSIEYHNGTLGISEPCVTCHGSANLITLHAGDCAVCHPSPRTTFTTWDKGCQQGGCHTSIHPDEASGHVSQDDCFRCHYEDTYELACTECHVVAPDTTPPVTARSPITTALVDTTPIALSAWDESGPRGVKATYYRIDGGVTATGTPVIVAPANGTAAHVLEYWSVDWSANVETTHVVPVTVSADVTPPTTTSDAKLAYNGPAVITFTVTDDATVPGGCTTSWSVDGGPTQSGTVATVAQPFSGSAGHTLQYWSVDRRGNAETPTTVSFTITTDAIAPSTTCDVPHYWSPTVTQILNFYITDPAPSSGVGDLGISVTNGNVWSKWGVGGSNNLYWRASLSMYLQGPLTLTFWATDNAGNIESQNTTTVVVDWSVPVSTTDAVPNYVGTATIHFSATDTYSPIAETKYAMSYPGFANTAVTGTSVTLNPPASGYSSGYVYYYSKDAAGNWEGSTSHVAFFKVWAVGTPTLTYLAGTHGAISGVVYQPVLSGGSGTAVTAVADNGYHFVNWSDGSAANPRTDTNVTVSKSVTANFALGP